MWWSRVSHENTHLSRHDLSAAYLHASNSQCRCVGVFQMFGWKWVKPLYLPPLLWACVSARPPWGPTPLLYGRPPAPRQTVQTPVNQGHNQWWTSAYGHLTLQLRGVYILRGVNDDRVTVKNTMSKSVYTNGYWPSWKAWHIYSLHPRRRRRMSDQPLLQRHACRQTGGLLISFERCFIKLLTCGRSLTIYSFQFSP